MMFSALERLTKLQALLYIPLYTCLKRFHATVAVLWEVHVLCQQIPLRSCTAAVKHVDQSALIGETSGIWENEFRGVCPSGKSWRSPREHATLWTDTPREFPSTVMVLRRGFFTYFGFKMSDWYPTLCTFTFPESLCKQCILPKEALTAFCLTKLEKFCFVAGAESFFYLIQTFSKKIISIYREIQCELIFIHDERSWKDGERSKTFSKRKGIKL